MNVRKRTREEVDASGRVSLKPVTLCDESLTATASQLSEAGMDRPYFSESACRDILSSYVQLNCHCVAKLSVDYNMRQSGQELNSRCPSLTDWVGTIAQEKTRVMRYWDSDVASRDILCAWILYRVRELDFEFSEFLHQAVNRQSRHNQEAWRFSRPGADGLAEGRRIISACTQASVRMSHPWYTEDARRSRGKKINTYFRKLVELLNRNSCGKNIVYNVHCCDNIDFIVSDNNVSLPARTAIQIVKLPA